MIRCPGCDKGFTRHGLSLHISKTRRRGCQNLHQSLQTRMVVQPAQAASSLAPNTGPKVADGPIGHEPAWEDETDAASSESSQQGDSANEDSTGDEADHTGDPVDTADANAFESISRDGNFSSLVTPEPEHVNGSPCLLPPPEDTQPSIPGPCNPDARPISFVIQFPHGQAGAPVASSTPQGSAYESTRNRSGNSVWAPFRSQCDWEFARWAKMRGATASAVTALLAILELVDKLGLSYKTSAELNNLIDKALPGRPSFQCEDLVIGGETLQFHYRDIVPCIRSLFGNPEFAHELVFAPERHYTDAERTCRVYSEMHTGDWWWSVQMSLEARNAGATVIPLIISSDKTLLTHFRDKEAYPIYLGIGNIPKSTRRKPSRSAQMLIGYVPITKLVGITNKAARRRALASLFHSCMAKVLDPIRAYGETGLAMQSGDGTWRRCHPVFATFVGDYPEQVLVTCIYKGRCPKCLVPVKQLGNYDIFPTRNHVDAIDTYLLASEDIRRFRAACREAGLKSIFRPFWSVLPLVDIFVSITPDVLHQLLQGVVKYLTAWLTTIFGAAEVDARCRSLPPNHHISLFTSGISTLSQLSGKQHKDICRFLLGLVIDLALPGGQLPSRLIRAARALLDFVYLAQYSSHTSKTLQRLEDSLARFHENKDVFIDLGVREHLDIPKFHSMLHYRSSITLFGTTDNYNTEQSERLHIDFTKDAYRATNRKNEYPQMTAWLERREKIQIRTASIEWQPQRDPTNTQTSTTSTGPLQVGTRYLKMTLHPTVKAVTFDELAAGYGAVDFQDALADFIALINYPGASAAMLRTRAADTLLPFRSVPVFHRIKYASENSEIVDSAVIRPEQKDGRGRTVPQRFDTVLVRGKRQDVMHGSNGNRIAQVRVVFQIPSKVVHNVFFNDAPTHLAYIEWFSPLSPTPDINHLMYKVSRLTHRGRRRAAVIPVGSIIGSVHLIPRFGEATPDWNSFSVLEQCSTFYVNSFSDQDNYLRFG
ncbi:hypothetical protein EDB83DRAFT_2323339 [Lactarius deliciosus]|nr:hypothetical protein EDB83DRAFT_2323339 [Lactarius deliciosus]